MNGKGGYKLINFKGVELSTTPVTDTGALADLLNNMGKAVLLSGVNIGGTIQSECFAVVMSDGDDGVKLNCYDGYIIVTKSGAVTYTQAAMSSIPTLTDDVTKLKSINGSSIASNTSLINMFNKLNIYETANTFISGTYLNNIFGINVNGCCSITRMSETVALLVIHTTLNESIFKGVATISGSNVAWSGRYVFEGTAYTPA